METPHDVKAFIAGIAEAEKRADAEALAQMMQDISGEPPALWGSMVGFGRYRYRYDSGHEGESFLVGFAPRKAEFALYLGGGMLPDAVAARETLLPRLGRHRAGKGCIYIRRLADIDSDVLRQLVDVAVRALREEYGEK